MRWTPHIICDGVTFITHQKWASKKKSLLVLTVDGVLLRMELEVRYRNWGRPAGFAVSTICFLSRRMISLFYTTRSESYLNTFRGATKMRYEWCGWAHWWIFYVYFLSSVVFFQKGDFHRWRMRLNNVAVANTLHTAVLMGICSSSSRSFLTPPWSTFAKDKKNPIRFSLRRLLLPSHHLFHPNNDDLFWQRHLLLVTF